MKNTRTTCCSHRKAERKLEQMRELRGSRVQHGAGALQDEGCPVWFSK
jgi:hypothetical protein